MSAPAHPTHRSPLAFTDDQSGFTDVQLQALQLASRWRSEPPAAALDLFFHAARTSELDPLREQIRLLQRSEPVVTATGSARIEQRWSIETSIHGFRILGDRTARDRGIRVARSAPRYYDDRSRTWVDAWPYPTPPIAARYTLTAVQVGGGSESAVGIVHFTEFVKLTVDGNPSRGWEKMPCHMLAKCAEADAWRRLFPDQLGWLRLADGADTAHEPSPSDSDTITRHPEMRDPINVLGKPRTAVSPAQPDTTAPSTQPNDTHSPATGTAPESADNNSIDATPRKAPATKRSQHRPATSRRTTTTAATDTRSALLAAASAALNRDSADVLAWASEQLDRPINAPGDLTPDDLTRLRAALPQPAPPADAAAATPEDRTTHS